MIRIQKILHPTDFSEGAAEAFEHALHLARHFEAELHLLHVVPTLGEDPIRNAFDAAVADDAFARKMWDEADGELRALVAAHQHRHVKLRRVLAQGVSAGPVILEYAEAERVEAIVMGTQGRRGLGHLLLGSTAEEVVHKAACHVLTVRRQAGPGDEPRPIQRLLVPVDFSEVSRPLLRLARELAADYNAHLDVLHVIQPLPFAVAMMEPISVYELVPDLTEKTRAQLQQYLEEAGGPDVSSSFHVAEGQPARTIVQTAQDLEDDVIVIAPHGWSRIERFLLGSVAERVVRTASCPVFVAKTGLFDKQEAEVASQGAALS